MFKWLKRHLGGVAFGLGMGLVAASYANVTSTLPTYTGPQDPSQLNAMFTQLVNAANTQLFNYINMPTSGAEAGELQISGPNSNTWAANGTIGTTMTSLGPQGSHTTVQEWLVVFDTNGFMRFIPAY